MKIPIWIGCEEALGLHDLLLSQYGGCMGVRDQGLLESALARPQQIFAHGKPTLADLGAAYAAGVIKNHAFFDGNKRTGFMLGAGFLELNGQEFFASEADAAIRTLALAAGEMSEAAYAEWLEQNSRTIT